MKEAGYKETVISALGAESDKILSSPIITALKEKIEPAVNGTEINLSSPDEINKLIAELVPDIGTAEIYKQPQEQQVLDMDLI